VTPETDTQRPDLIEAKRRPYPSLYQVNTRVWLTELGRALRRPATLDDIPDAELDWLAQIGFDWVWFLSVWSTGHAGLRASRSCPEWRKEFEHTLPDLRETDIGGSGFAITGYTVHPALGGNAALGRLRDRLRKRGLRLLLDFIPNHTALDHPWVEQHPEYYLAGTAADLQREPHNYVKVRRRGGDLILAHGRDPYFPAWSDTLQLDYSNPAVQEVMIGELMKVASQCDGVRCDMAMLVLPEIIERTWHRAAQPFWPRAIGRVREQHPEFCFVAEVYWDLEWTMHQQGFDYAYDKRLYDRLIEGAVRPIRDHFLADREYQDKLARFLENHDEPRAAATFPIATHQAAAVTTFLSPGLRFFHQGQFEGRKKHVSPHLVRAPVEPVDETLSQFYDRLLAVLRCPQAREGRWQMIECAPAWEGNGSWDCFLAFTWTTGPGDPLLIAVNYAPHRSQCFVKLSWPELANGTARLRDLMGPAQYDRDGDDLLARGLFLDLPPWGYHVFTVTRL
jgi:hypothetical protein